MTSSESPASSYRRRRALLVVVLAMIAGVIPQPVAAAATGGISFVKSLTGGLGGETFSFTSDIPGCEEFSLVNGQTHFCDAGPGTYTITEQDAGDRFTVSAITCANGATNETVDLDAGSLTATVNEDESPSCTFHNLRHHSGISFVKSLTGGLGGETFSFTSDIPGCEEFSLVNGQTHFCDAGPGTYTITEQDAGDRFTVSAITCANGATNETVDLDAGSLTATVNEDESPSCTFHNLRHHSGISFVKSLTGGLGGETFSFTSDIPGCEEFSLVNGQTHFCDAGPGTYTITEQDAGDRFTVSAITCANGATNETVDLDAGSLTATVNEDESPSCTFHNLRHHSGISFVKSLTGGLGGETFSFTSDIPGCEEFSLVNGQTHFCDAGPGTYTITEQDAGDRFTVSAITCANGATNETVDLDAGSLTATVNEDESPSCTFHNLRHHSGISFVKSLTGGLGGETFSFTSDIPGCEEFSLVNGQTHFCDAGPGTYTITEQDAGDRFTVSAITCANGATNETVDLDAGSLTATVNEDESPSCTFHNLRHHSGISFVKSLTGGLGGETFSFTSDIPGCEEFSLVNGQTHFCDAGPGTYTITEQDAGDRFTVSAITCANGATNETVDLDAGSLTATVNEDESPSCTFHNTNTDQRGRIVIDKRVLPEGSGDQFFFFDTDPLTDCTGRGVLGAGTIECVVVPGTYAVTERDPGPNFALTDLSCDDANSTVDKASRTATYNIDPAETVTCTFTNTDQRGRIVIDKRVLPEGSGDQFFFFDTDPLTDCTGRGVLGAGTIECVVVPGTYAVTERDPGPNFALTDLSCDDANSTVDKASRTATYNIDPAETVTCTFTNTDQRGRIVIDKRVLPEGSGDQFFFFDTDPLTDCTGRGVLGAGTIECVVVPGTYAVTERDPGPNFALTDLSCDDANSTVDKASRTATYNIDPAETVTCTFTNTDQRGRIVIDKRVLPEGSGDQFFFFDTDPLTDCTGRGVLGAGTIECVVVPGTYAVTERDPGPNFALTDLSCDDANSTVDKASRTATYNIDPAETVTCTFTNTDQRGRIVIDKRVLPEGSGDQFFFFDTDPLTDCTGRGVLGAGTIECVVVPGTYAVTERDPGPNFALTDLSCDDANSTVDKASRTATYNIDPAETVTCTFTNTDQRGRIVIDKRVLPEGSGDQFFFFDTDPLTDCTGRGVLGAGTIECVVVPGTYAVTERDPGPNFALTDLSCDDANSTVDKASRTATYNIDPAETVTCTFTNTDQRGRIVIDKRVLPEGSGDQFFFFDTDPLTDCTGRGVLGAGTIECVVVPGTYAVTERDPGPNFALTDLSCDDANSTVDKASRTATYNIDPAETVTCTFTNTDQRGRIVIDKRVLPEGSGDQFFFFDTDPLTDCTGRGVLGAGTIECVVVPGTYAVTERDPGPNFALTDLSCDDANSTVDKASRTATYNIDPAETVTCTFTNTDQRGRIVIDKRVLPEGSGDQFFFFDTDPLTDCTGRGVLGAGTIECVVVPGTYAVTERDPGPNFALTDLSCDDANSTVDKASRTATYNIDPAETVTCTFTNTDQRGRIVIDKRVLPEGSGDQFFFFDTDPLTDCTGRGVLGAGTIECVVVPGTYAVTERDPGPNFALTDLSCDDANSTVDKASRTATYNIDPAETVTCTFTNTDQRGRIVIDKRVLPEGSGDQFFFFDTDPLTDCTGRGVLGAGTIECVVVPGTYAVTERDPGPNFALTDLSCDDANSTVDKASRTATYNIDPAETVTCTFTNTDQRGRIVIDKRVLPEGSGDQFFFFDTDPLTDCTGRGVLGAGTIECVVVPGTYAVTERDPGPNFALTDLSCDDANSTVDKASRTATYNIDPAETVTCTFTNTDQRGRIVIDKRVLPEGSGDQFFFFDTDPLTDCTGRGVLGAGTIECVVVPGTYAVTERDPGPNFALTDLSCDDANSTVDKASRTATYNIDPAETVTCTFTNTDQRGRIVIDKRVLPEGSGDQFFFFDTDPLTDCTGRGVLGAGTIECVVVPGTYAVTERDPGPNFALTDLSCDDANSTVDKASRTATYNIDPAETVTCTFTNTDQRGRIVIDKRVLPEGSGDQFFFFDTDPLTDCTGRGVLGAGTIECVVVPGTYAVTERDPGPNFALTDLSCDDANSTVDKASRTATYNIDPAETVTCTFTNTEALPSVQVNKTANPPTLEETGGPVAFTYDVKNISAEPVKITSLVDDKFGPLTGDANCNVGTTLSPGASCAFELTMTISGDFPGTHENTFTAKVTDDQGNVAEGSASATVTFADALPTIDVTKSANPNSVLFTGGAVEYVITVKNTGLESVTVSSLVDSKFGDLTGVATCRRSAGTVVTIPFTLSVSEIVTCKLTKNLSGEMNTNGLGFKLHTNTVTGTAFDDENNRTTDSASATVSFFWRGRTPGFWKNHTQAGTWPSPYAPTTKLSTVFTLPQGMCGGKLAAKFTSDTLLKALAYTGGSTLSGKAEILFRHAVAAVLNEQFFGALYPPHNTTTELITAVNNTLASCDPSKYVAFASKLDFWNNGVH